MRQSFIVTFSDGQRLRTTLSDFLIKESGSIHDGDLFHKYFPFNLSAAVPVLFVRALRKAIVVSLTILLGKTWCNSPMWLLKYAFTGCRGTWLADRQNCRQSGSLFKVFLTIFLRYSLMIVFIFTKVLMHTFLFSIKIIGCIFTLHPPTPMGSLASVFYSFLPIHCA